MRPLPPKLLRGYQDLLKTSKVDRKQHASYLKWLRYYFDFFLKYAHKGTDPDSCVSFLAKLQSKGQADSQIRQADQAVGLYMQLAANLSENDGRGVSPATRGKVSSQE